MAVEIAITKCVSLGRDSVLVVAELDCQGLKSTPVLVTGCDISEAVIIEHAVAIEIRRCRCNHCYKVHIIALKHIQQTCSGVNDRIASG
jgi:hypothetical protein